jgi:lactoylglutathione lyase
MNFKIDHANINVTDIDRSIAFYEEALGLKLVRRSDAADGSFTLAFVGDGAGAFNIELTWLRDKAGPYELGDNESHIAFSVTDIEGARRLHSQMGVICFENEAMGLYFIEDPDGYWIEIFPERTANG